MKKRRQITVPLPTIKAQIGLVKPRAIKDGDLAHVRLEFRDKVAVRTGPDDVRNARIHSFLVPAPKAKEWLELGVPASPLVTTHSGFGRGLTRADPEVATMFAHVRIRFGSKDTTNLYVPDEQARRWLETALRFERLLSDYRALMKQGG